MRPIVEITILTPVGWSDEYARTQRFHAVWDNMPKDLEPIDIVYWHKERNEAIEASDSSDQPMFIDPARWCMREDLEMKFTTHPSIVNLESEDVAWYVHINHAQALKAVSQ